jgi:hypothetical protein
MSIYSIEMNTKNNILQENSKTKKNTHHQNIDEYIDYIYSNCEKTMPQIKKTGKVSDENVIIPTTKSYDILLRNNYNLQQLKTIAKHYKMKISGNKNELVNRLYVFLKLSSIIVKIQKIFRGNVQRKYNQLHGPAFLKRELCTNQSDFLTMEEMKEMDATQFFSFKDSDGFIYGFDIISLYNLILKSGKSIQNPYNRNVIPNSVIHDFKSLIRTSKILKIPIEVDIKDVCDDLSDTKSVELKILDLFQFIDSLGNYSNPEWFLSLVKPQIIKFMRELVDIWNYRAQLPSEVKRLIYPPGGNPFVTLNINSFVNENNIVKLQKMALYYMERIVKSAQDKDHMALGAYYVLGALTLVNPNAAAALPWLFQSVAYF